MNLTEILLVFLISTLIAYSLKYLWSWWKFLVLASKIPSVKFEIPLIGILIDFLFIKFEDYLPLIVNFFEESPSISRKWMGSKLIVLVNSPENVQVVLNSPHCNKRPPIFYEAYLATEGLVLINGQKWEHHRKILKNSFSSQMLQNIIPIFDERSSHYIKRLNEKVDCDDFDIYQIVAGCTLESLLQGNLNMTRDFYENEYFDDVEKLKHCTMERMFQPWLGYEKLYKMTKLYKKCHQAYASTVALADEVVNANHHLRIADELKNRNVISQLLNVRNNFTDNEIKDELITFIIVAHETTALTLSGVILMLAIHKDVQEKVFSEIREVVNSNEGMIDIETLHKLTYLEMVIKETMRIFPVVPAFGREATDEFKLEDFVIPKGTLLISSIFSLHRNTKYWGEDAHLFKPERFRTENLKKIHPYAFIPFTGGRRICLGWKYTMLFKKAFLIHFLRAFEVNTKLKFNELKVNMTPTVAIEQNYMISIKKRQLVK
ncbi:hypothetical protein PVAND_011249 [Polypedilum vanderplanki]|uniref:Cytochrome P450 n=1 Tax=Polypedilum vanderplanki TaxID=319348 RepID=A0A9J6CHZ5_POLVA|nr:hypothetical protein PVAND_011249 [Polypedilum vanderplanki]